METDLFTLDSVPINDEALAYAITHDDGQSAVGLSNANLILVGVSGCGKTQLSLHLAQRHHIKVANYPLIPEDFNRERLPDCLYSHWKKIMGLSINAERLALIRSERYFGSRYASIEICRHEVAAAEAMMQAASIKWRMTDDQTLEEIAAEIMREFRKWPETDRV